MGDQEAAPGRNKHGSRDPQIFVLMRELSEVHLLLDNVSANPNKTVSEGARVARPKDLDKNWVEKVCQISWPPDGSEDERAEDAALLIRAKDYLNRLSRPASGASIAFTLLVTQGGKKRGWLSRKLTGDSSSPTRNTLAQTAYPDLVGKAASFRKVMASIGIGLVLALLFTCALSWYVAYGNAALAELGTAREAMLEAQTEVDKAGASLPSPSTDETTEAPASAGEAQTQTQTSQQASTSSQLEQAQTQARQEAQRVAAAYSNYCQGNLYSSAAQEQLCTARQRTRANVVLVEERLASWSCWRPVADCQGEKIDEPDRLGVAGHAATLVSILGTAVLPFLYGLLGAGAAIIRSLSSKIRASLLSPRDLHLSFQQLALGAVVGACIGLFVAPPGADASGDTLVGPVTLSASAISFIAGFGVEAVFQALEQLIRRIFNVPAPAAGHGSEEQDGR